MLTCTVVLALYNGEKYIADQLQSLFQQTHTPECVIISDDGSFDCSELLVKGFIQKNHLEDKWIYRKNKKNLGYANNFWHAAKNVDTQVCFFCDQDDIWKPEKIDVMLKIMEINPQIMLLGSGYTAFTDTGERYNDVALTKVLETGELENIKLNEKTIFIGCEGCTMAFRTDFMKKVGKYRYDRAPHDEFLWKMAVCCNGCYILHRSLMMRRFHANNVTHNKMHNKQTRMEFLKLLLKSHQAMLMYAVDRNMSVECLNLIQRNIDSVKLRIELLENGNIWNSAVLLIKYRNNYHSKKAIIIELLMALKIVGR